MKKFLSIFILNLFLTATAFATHNRAGEITYCHIEGLKYEITITTYTKESSYQADRDRLEIQWGDGNTEELFRTNGNGNGESLGNDIKKNVYTGSYTYPGPGTYILKMEDPNRNSGIINMTGSVNIPFYLETVLIIPAFGGQHNCSPKLLNPPIDNACVDRLYIHNPWATDDDGDSLSYSLIDVKGAGGQVATGYYLPANVTINEVTGDLIWNKPQTVGEFNFAILITEWRKLTNGTTFKIGTVVRDMQVTVGPCTNNPPIISPLQDTCIEAGTHYVKSITANDPENKTITLNANGGVFTADGNKATFPQGISGTGTVTGTLEWATQCGHVRIPSYSVFVKAEDIGDINLVDYKNYNIKVIGPSPKNPVATASGNNNNIQLSWEASVCSEVTDYDIYRRTGSYCFVPSYCETGVPAYTGFAKIATVNGHSTTTFIDENLIHGQKYCYMVVAIFPDKAESYASVEVCAELKKDVPIITNVSVEATSINGRNFIAWSAPTELNDTTDFTGPYYYRIYRSADMNGNNFILIDSTQQSPVYFDTTYVNLNVNTSDTPNSYKIELMDLSQGLRSTGSTHNASSVFLDVNTVPAGEALSLSWQVNVPWTNVRYDVFRFNSITSVFDSIGTTTAISFTDTGLTNDVQYCYYIRSTGEYSVDGILKPLLNNSQEKCGIPQDLEPPCQPSFFVNADCDQERNTLRWSLPEENVCRNDAVGYHIYFTPVKDGTFEKITTIESNSTMEFVHQRINSIAGCYFITAYDKNGNESASLDTICVDNCPVYELPNVFSPDGDGLNDFFRPFPYKFVESIEIQIFNRWGQLIFETKNPDIFWNGVNASTEKPSTEGVYFYVCTVNEIRLSGIEPRSIKGFFHLFRNADVVPQRPN